MVLLTVGEGDLPAALGTVPEPWRGRVVLVQNELLPETWEELGLRDPTIAVVWFEKKPGRAVRQILPTPVAGPVAADVVEVLGAAGIDAREVPPGPSLEDELVAKNLYILAFNVAGLVAADGATVADLHGGDRFQELAAEILALQGAALGRSVDEEAALSRVAEAVAADPEHGARGRTAPARLARAVRRADSAGLDVPGLRRVAREAGVDLDGPVAG